MPTIGSRSTLLKRWQRALLPKITCDWVYPDFQCFGTEFKNWKPLPQLNPFRFFFENSCGAPSLIRRRVFDAGVFYDETMRDGYEDWEFFLRALTSGFWGASAGNVGFNYRVRKQSMLVETRKKHKRILKSMHERLYVRPWTLTACEHKYMPRFRFIDQHGRHYDFSDPMRGPWERVLRSGICSPDHDLGLGTAFELLKRSGTLRGILFSVQHQVRTHALRIDLEHRETGLGFERKEGLGGIPLLFAIQSTWLADGTVSADNIRSVVSSAHSLTISSPDYRDLPINSNALDFELLFRHASVLASGEAETAPVPFENRQPPNSWFAREHHLASDETTYPFTRDDEIDLCFVVPWLRLGGVDQCVLRCAEAVKRSVQSVRLHLLLTDLGSRVRPSTAIGVRRNRVRRTL